MHRQARVPRLNAVSDPAATMRRAGMGSKSAKSVDDGEQAREYALEIVVLDAPRTEPEVVGDDLPLRLDRLLCRLRESSILDVDLADRFNDGARRCQRRRWVLLHHAQSPFKLFMHRFEVTVPQNIRERSACHAMKLISQLVEPAE